ncbi:MAG: dTDP-4-dehydrorhamnose reductase [Gammaproteobacteria bacterium]|nr:dTDP-4-dehydrorhamnose reductase [Gammaproteobacteria bacterium]
MDKNLQNILLIGKNGQVGWELQRTLAPLGNLVVTDRGDKNLPVDLSNPDEIRSLVRKIRPALIINAAAYTEVDKAEEEFDKAMAINGTAPGVLAEEARETGAALVHYSTDYVYDGKADAPYKESDTPTPINAYGCSKLEGDRAVEAVGGAYLILRTSWIYGTRGSNFLLTMLRLARERETLKIVDDQTGSPTWCRLIAECTAQILARANCRSGTDKNLNFIEYLENYKGIYNLTSSGSTSWYGFARAILDDTQGIFENRIKEISPIPTSQYPVAAPRPTFSAMSGEKLYCTFGQRLPQWHQALDLCLQDLGEHDFGTKNR